MLIQLQQHPRDRAPIGNANTALPDALLRAIEGEVRFDAGSRALYAADASNYRHPPIGVVIPKHIDDIVRTVAECCRAGAPLLSRGGGTSLAGQCCNEAVVMDMSKYVNRVLSVDPERKLASVEPGAVLDRLRERTEEYGLTFGPDPSTHNHCTLGGMLGNNSCGVHSVLSEFYGPGPRTEDNVHSLDVLTYRGQRFQVAETGDHDLHDILNGGDACAAIYRSLLELRDRYAPLIRKRFPNIPRRVSGYNLPDLLPENGFNLARALVGTESTCVTVLGATLKLTRGFPKRTLVICGFPDIATAGDRIPEFRTLKPVGLEGFDDLLVEFVRKKGKLAESLGELPEGRGWLMVECGGDTQAAANACAQQAVATIKTWRNPPSMLIVDDPEHQEHLWKVRKSGLGVTAFVPGERDSWPGWEDSAVPVDQVGRYIRELHKLYDKYGYRASLYGHFGQGCVHTRITFDLRSERGRRNYRAFTRDAAELVVRLGGSLSGEHGDGQSRGELLPLMYGDELVQAFREFKRIWDPDWKMNPGKVVDAEPRDQELRIANYPAFEPDTVFAYTEDRHFSHAAMRCVGVGECRREQGGTMCPSYRATHEEKHTTRGRAHLLFEMLHGGIVHQGWDNADVMDSLHLCLSCKGCKSDCPVNVDIATYKAEFLAHYYRHHLRPRSAHSFGRIQRWAKLASLAPKLANWGSHAQGLSRLAKWATGCAPQRTIPRFAPHTFRAHFKRDDVTRDGEVLRRKLRPHTGRTRDAHAPRAHHTSAQPRRVLLWPDTFNNHFFPSVLDDTRDVLERAGCEVVIPRRQLCCGRPLYDYGFLDAAKSLWEKTLASLAHEIDRGTPIVGAEPSCIAAFRDELPNLYPRNQRARTLAKHTYTLAEFLCHELDDYTPPPLREPALIHLHCHHKAIMGTAADKQLFQAMHLDHHILDSGCCGMAGAFGFERDKYDVSVAIAEHELLPSVRNAAPTTHIVIDGFSCREQILQLTDKTPIHMAALLRRAYAQHAS